MNARRFIGIAPLIVAAIPAAALARDCNEVKAAIDAKITAKGVADYVLEVVDTPERERREEDCGHLRWRGEANRLSQRHPSGTQQAGCRGKARWNLTIG